MSTDRQATCETIDAQNLCHNAIIIKTINNSRLFMLICKNPKFELTITVFTNAGLFHWATLKISRLKHTLKI